MLNEAKNSNQKNKTVLIIDDCVGERRLYANILTEAGYEVTEATSAEEAICLFGGQTRWRYLIVDYNMPGMNGGDLIRLVAARAMNFDLVMLLSGLEANSPQVISLTADVCDKVPFSYCHKEVDPSALSETLRLRTYSR